MLTPKDEKRRRRIMTSRLDIQRPLAVNKSRDSHSLVVSTHID